MRSESEKSAQGSQSVDPGQAKKLVLQTRKRTVLTSPDAIQKIKRPTMDLSFSQADDFDDDDYEEQMEQRAAVPIGVVPQQNFAAQVHAPKKLGIKRFQRREINKESKLSQYWPLLQESVEAIQANIMISYSLENLYKMIEDLCEVKLNLGAELYDRLQRLLRIHVERLRNILSECIEKDEDIFLGKMNLLWSDYCQQCMMIRNIFLYLDRTYVLQTNNVPSLWEAGLNIFREGIMDKDLLRKRLTTGLLKVIDNERKGKHINRDLIRSLLKMLLHLQIYNQVFERAFLSASDDLYHEDGEKQASELDPCAYFKYVAQKLDEEANRVDYYLDESTRKPLIALIEHTLIARHMETVVSKGLNSILDENKLEDLSLIYMLLVRTSGGSNLLKTGFANYIKRVGKAIVMDTERDKNMVERLMEFKAKLDTIVETCFKNEEKIQQAEKDSFDYFVNTRPSKPAELIAKFMDAKLRSGNKESSDEELDKIMDRVITLFRFIQGKDVFEAFYKKDLAKRLLLGRSASVDAEKAMLCKLRQECGAGFTHKLEGMFKDMELSLDLCQSFRQHIEHEVEQGKCQSITEFNVNILTLGQWPNYEPVELTLPSTMCRSLQMFQEFYTAKHQGRKLQWQHSLGQCVLKGAFRKGCVKELQASLYQGVVLLLFNECQEMTLAEIAVATKIEPKELKRTMFSLCVGKTRILLRDSKEKELADTDKFTVNSGLQEKLYRIKISQVQLKETEEEHKQTEEEVNTDRQYQIDAACVRIMKTRKTLSHHLFIDELFRQLRFPVKAADLKKRIASLIERDYISRDADDHNIYKYVA